MIWKNKNVVLGAETVTWQVKHAPGRHGDQSSDPVSAYILGSSHLWCWCLGDKDRQMVHPLYQQSLNSFRNTAQWIWWKVMKEHPWCQLWASTCMHILLHLYPHRLKMCTPQTHAKKMGCHVNVCVVCVCREGSSELWISPGAILWNKWIPKKYKRFVQT